jgi:hypothetical protein
MRPWIHAGIVALALWSPAVSSSAGTLEVSFAFDQGTIGFGVPGVFMSQATSFSGSGRVVLTGVDSLGMLTGPSAAGQLRDVSLMFIGPTPNGTFTFGLPQEGVATGSFNGSALALPQGALAFRLTNQAGGNVPLINPTMGFNLPIQSLGTPGSALLGLAGIFVGGGGGVLLDLQGREVARRFSAPEGSVCLT